jgi:hypothetical protein
LEQGVPTLPYGYGYQQPESPYLPQGQPQPYFPPQPQPLPYLPQGQPQMQQPPMQQPYYPQPQPQPQYQPPTQQPYYQPPQAQAAPVPPVGMPMAPQAQGQSQAQMTPQQAFNRQLINIAKLLEQSLPGYQMLASVVNDLSKKSAPGAEDVGASLRDAAFHHYAALGAIRRFLTGETTPDLLAALATATHTLMRLHGKLRPLIEPIQSSSMPDVRMVINGILQAMNGIESLLNQAGGAVKEAVGPHTWESARTSVYDS